MSSGATSLPVRKPVETDSIFNNVNHNGSQLLLANFDISSFLGTNLMSSQMPAQIAKDPELSKREATIITADMKRAIKNQNKKLDAQCSSNDASSNIDKVTKEMQKAKVKIQKFEDKNLDVIKCLKQRNSLAIACVPILALAIKISAVAIFLGFIFAAPLAFVLAGAILLATGIALGVSSLIRHLQYQSLVNSAAKLIACDMQIIKQVKPK